MNAVAIWRRKRGPDGGLLGRLEKHWALGRDATKKSKVDLKVPTNTSSRSTSGPFPSESFPKERSKAYLLHTR